MYIKFTASVLLRCAVLLGNWCPTFRDNLTVAPSSVEMYKARAFRPLNMKPLGFLGKSSINYLVTWRHIPQEIRQQRSCSALRFTSQDCVFAAPGWRTSPRSPRAGHALWFQLRRQGRLLRHGLFAQRRQRRRRCEGRVPCATSGRTTPDCALHRGLEDWIPCRRFLRGSSFIPRH